MDKREEYLRDIDKRIAKESAELEVKESQKKQKPKLKNIQLQNIQKEIKKRMDSISDDDVLSYFVESTLGDAKLFQLIHRDIIIFVKHWNRFLLWAGHHWIEDEFNASFSFIENICELYLRVADNKKELLNDTKDQDTVASLEQMINKIEKKVYALRTPKGGENILVMVQRTRQPMMVLPKQFDKHHYFLACPNGVVDLRTGDIMNGKSQDYMLKHCETIFNIDLFKAENPAPETNAFLLRSMDGSEELVNFIWRLLGYGLIRDRKDHVFPIFWGEHGRNGKDTLIKLVTKVLGLGLSGDIPVEMFLQTQQARNSSAPSPDILALRGMCLGWVNEAEDGQRFALARLKKLTGGGYITARGLQDKEQTTWLQTHLPIMTTNELPRAKADDAAFWQRVIILKWQLSFVEDVTESYQREADKHLDEKVQAEAEGVLVMLIRGAMDYLARGGLDIPKQVKEWTTGQQMQNDDLGQFIAECCDVEEYKECPDDYQTKIQANELLEYFHIWYSRNKDHRDRAKLSPKMFAILLRKKNIPSKKSNGIKYLGIKLKGECEVDLIHFREAKQINTGIF